MAVLKQQTHEPRTRQDSRLHVWYEPGNFLTEASALQKLNYVILYIPRWIQANDLPS